MRRPIALIPIALLACRSAPVTPAVITAPPAARVEETPPDDALRVRGREFSPMPRCEAVDAVTLARSTSGVPATPALARGPGGGLAAFVSIPAGERVPRITVTPLDPQGARVSPRDVALLDAGDAPALPNLVADGDGYLLAWRSGAPGQQQARLRRLDARGVPAGAIRAVGPRGYVGAITLRAVEGGPLVAFAHRDDRAPRAGEIDGSPWATSVRVFLGERETRVDAPPGGAFVGEAPRVTGDGASLRLWAVSARADGGAADEHALLTRRLDVEDTLHLLARDLDRVDARAVSEGTLLTWRARVARRDVALRAAVIRDDGSSASPPVTLATFRGAADLRPAIVPVGAGLQGVLTLSALADDANVSVDVAALDLRGAPLGRAPSLTSFLARSTRAAVAEAPEGAADPLAWALVDGRDSADGAPTLLVTRFGCDAQRPAPQLDVHPGTWVQRLAEPEAATLDLARIGASPAAMSCATQGTRPFVTHVSGQETDALVGTSAAVVMTPAGAQLYAVVRTEQGRTRLVTTTINAAGVATPVRTVREGTVSLPPAARPLDALVPAARLREGDVVLDGLRQGGGVVALLGRDDATSGDVARAVALARNDGLDPFADPLGHPRGDVLLGPSSRDEPGALSMLFTDQNVLRRSEIIDGAARSPRSLLQALPGGGALLAGSWSGASRWVALSTGDPGDGRNVGALTLARVDREGVRGATRLFPEDGSVVPQRVAMAAAGDRVVILFLRAEQGGAVTWTWADLRCAVPGGAR